MKKILLVIYDPSIENQILDDRIKSLGPSFVFWRNHWFVETNLSSKEVYQRISANEFETASIIIVELSSEKRKYYGRMNTALWDWLKSIEE